MTEAAGGGAVTMPAGLPILEAAAWVGHACWAELRLHQTITGWLAVEAGPATVTTLWAVRAHRAELAESWHRRLPELREHPREQFVRSSPAGDAGFVPLDALTAADAGPERVAALTGVLTRLLAHYRSQVAVAVGPADAPTADTLQAAITRTESDLALLQA